jgi:hypothetical protein
VGYILVPSNESNPFADDASNPTTSHDTEDLWPERPYRAYTHGPPEEWLWQEQSKGVKWTRGGQHGYYFCSWVTEPDLLHIETRMKDIYSRIGFPAERIAIEFLAQGSYDKTYVVKSYVAGEPGVRRLLRVAKALYPWYKTESEVATILYLRGNPRIPVPAVHAFESSPNNLIGYEWILMELMPGLKYADLINELSPIQQKDIKSAVHQYMQQLSSLSFNEIGSLYCDWKSATPNFTLVKQYHSHSLR